MRDEFIDELTKLAATDPSIMLITGDLGFGVLTDFADRFPNQFINAGVAEQNMTALACGLALEGLKVYTYSIGNFATLRCLEQIRNDVCYHDCDVTVVSVGGGFSYGQLGVSHFATEDLAILRAIPNMAVIAPSDAWETRELVKQMANYHHPKYLRLDKGNGNSPVDLPSVTLGKPRIVQEGTDITFVTIGAILSEVMSATASLADEGISSEVITLNALKPMDFEAVFDSIRKTKRLICAEEHSKIGGLSSAISEACFANNVHAQAFSAIGLEDEFPTIVGDQNYLRAAYKIDAENIMKVARSLCTSLT